MSWEDILKKEIPEVAGLNKEKLVSFWKRWLKDFKFDYERAFPRTEEEEELKQPMEQITLAIKRMEAWSETNVPRYSLISGSKISELERWHEVALFWSRKLHRYMGERGSEGPESFDIDWDTKERNL